MFISQYSGEKSIVSIYGLIARVLDHQRCINQIELHDGRMHQSAACLKPP